MRPTASAAVFRVLATLEGLDPAGLSTGPAAAVFEPALNLELLLCPAGWRTSATRAATISAIFANAFIISARVGMRPPDANCQGLSVSKFFLVMFFGDHVSEISLLQGNASGSIALGSGLRRTTRLNRCPGFEQHVGILHGRRPGKRVAIAMETFDDVHIFAVEIAAERTNWCC